MGPQQDKSLWVQTAQRMTWARARQMVLAVPTIVGFGPQAYRDLVAEMGEPALVEGLARLATEAGKPVVISLPDGRDGIFTTAIAPDGWSEERLRQEISPLMPHFEQRYGAAPEGLHGPKYWVERLKWDA